MKLISSFKVHRQHYLAFNRCISLELEFWLWGLAARRRPQGFFSCEDSPFCPCKLSLLFLFYWLHSFQHWSCGLSSSSHSFLAWALMRLKSCGEKIPCHHVKLTWEYRRISESWVLQHLHWACKVSILWPSFFWLFILSVVFCLVFIFALA